jgi:hypothetical protein
VDLREWDEFLEWDARTKDDPFVRTLEDLEGISTVIQALRDSTEVDAVLPFDTETL